MIRVWRATIAGLLVGAVLACSAAPAMAGDITVTTGADDFTVNGNCTLREAIQAANTNLAVDACPDPGSAGSADKVILGTDDYLIGITPDGTPDDNLDGDFDTDTDATAGNLTIQGNGRFNTEIDAQFFDRVFHLLGPGGTVTMQGVSVQQGLRSTGVADRGGGIFAEGAALALVQSQVFLSETLAEGGGVAATFPASMTFTDSFIIDNAAHGNLGGGGIFWSPGSSTPTLTLQGTFVLVNVATTSMVATDISGGGISSFGKLTMNSSELSGNSATVTTGTAHGGGISHNGFQGPLTFRDSVISGNSATNSGAAGSSQGGGINFFNAPSVGAVAVDLERTTLSGNFVDSPMGGLQLGGGAYGGNPSRMRLANSTVSGNQAPDTGGDGGGIHDNGVVLDIAHTTFAENLAADLGDAVRVSAATADTLKNSIVAEGAGACGGAFFTSAGGNVDAGSSCWSVAGAGDVQGQSPQLGPLAQNGGNVAFTHAIGVSSPARDRVPVADCEDVTSAFLNSDARGVSRPFPAGGLCDSGSYELIVCNGAAFTPSGPFTGCPPSATPPATPSPPAKKKCKKKKKKKRATAAKKRCKKKKKKR